MKKVRLAIFASGSGSNALNLIRTFKEHPLLETAFVLSNKTDAPVVESARAEGCEVLCCSNEEITHPEFLADLCTEHAIDLIVLAGFLRQIPSRLVHVFPNRILNIHPSLLPLYGGKGMYGRFVHEAVIQNRESQSGITIHLVNERYDEGEILAQFTCSLNSSDDVDSLQQKIHGLEMQHFPVVVEGYAKHLAAVNS
jgi:phosphoribosylglycinamide formyltransferase 1